MDQDKDLSRELLNIRHELHSLFQQGEWNELASSLEGLARLGETHGRKELCLRAQSLRELMGERAGGRATPGDRLIEIFNDLMFHLSHLQWVSQGAASANTSTSH